MELNKKPRITKIRLYFVFLFFLLLQEAAFARSTLIKWHDNSDDEDGFIIERTFAEDCSDGWEAIAYTRSDKNRVADIFLPGACYRVAAFNQHGVSTYSNVAQVPADNRKLRKGNRSHRGNIHISAD
jgi:hypothetical protein